MFIVYHNARCSKSREAVNLLEKLNKDFIVVEYLKTPLMVNELENIITQLQITPMELVRVKEKLWKEVYANKELTDKQILELLVKEPKLIERPIVSNGKKAVIGRPIENINTLIKK